MKKNIFLLLVIFFILESCATKAPVLRQLPQTAEFREEAEKINLFVAEKINPATRENLNQELKKEVATNFLSCSNNLKSCAKSLDLANFNLENLEKKILKLRLKIKNLVISIIILSSIILIFIILKIVFKIYFLGKK